MRSEILRLLDNTFTGNYEYGRSNEEKLPLPIQIKLSKKLQTFCHLFFAFFLSTWNFQYSEKKKKKKKKKMNLRGQMFLKLLTPKYVLI